jgi:hypothetical protein
VTNVRYLTTTNDKKKAKPYFIFAIFDHLGDVDYALVEIGQWSDTIFFMREGNKSTLSCFQGINLFFPSMCG